MGSRLFPKFGTRLLFCLGNTSFLKVSEIFSFFNFPNQVYFVRDISSACGIIIGSIFSSFALNVGAYAVIREFC